MNRAWGGLIGLVDTTDLDAYHTDVLVVGSGIAGLTAALRCSADRSVTLLTKGSLAQTNTWYAQGGIAGPVGSGDSVDLHVADTLTVGDGLCDERVVRAVIDEAPEALESLLGLGVRFDLAEEGGVALAREGGHSLPRVLHSGDRTGAMIQQALIDTLRSRERIPVREHRFLIDFDMGPSGAVRGAIVLDAERRVLESYRASAIVLATGGAGQVFPVTTNPPLATGDGIAAAWRAGAEVTDIEFVQFHPTALGHEESPRFLVSEALRGEGAYLLDCDGRRFMLDAHPLAELAPRDVVSREIERVMSRCGTENALLDARHIGASRLRARFPNIWRACADAGYDLSRELIPVVPAAHYLVGGIRTDIDGRTSLPRLYASGEVASTGLHGANRLASNSLLEGLVFSRRIARALDRDGVEAIGDGRPSAPAPFSRATGARDATASNRSGSTAEADALRARIHGAVREGLGMNRTAEGLRSCIARLEELGGFEPDPTDVDELEVADIVTVAGLIADAALLRGESRGCHSRLDAPARDDANWRKRVLLRRGAEPAFLPVDEEADDVRTP